MELQIILYQVSRQLHEVSGIWDTVLSWRPTEGRPVWCFVLFGIRLVDSLSDSRVTESPSWADARQKSNLSGVLSFSVSIQSANTRAIDKRQKGGASIWDTSLSFKYDGPKKNWTSDTSFRKRVLYPLSYRTNRTLLIVSLNACNFHNRLKKIPRVRECRRKA